MPGLETCLPPPPPPDHLVSDLCLPPLPGKFQPEVPYQVRMYALYPRGFGAAPSIRVYVQEGGKWKQWGSGQDLGRSWVAE